jgi:glucose/arabinose dehydrogenase
MPSAPSRIASIRPLWALEGSRLVLEGGPFALDPSLPEVTFGDVPARLAHASTRALTVVVPPDLPGGRTPIRVSGVAGETVYADVAAPLATGLHQVDNPAFDERGNLFVTFSGSRGQQGPVSLYVIRPDGTREPFVTGLPNPTALAFDPHGTLVVSSRFEGTLYRVDARGTATVAASELGAPCGIAFDAAGDLFVGDRNGSILRVRGAEATLFASVPSSVAAFHLAFGPDGSLYVAAPTLASSESLYRIDPDGHVERYGPAFGRPQGLAFDEGGRLYVADSLAGGGGGLFRIDPARPDEAELLVHAPGIVGLGFDPRGGLVLATSDTVYRLDVPLRGAPLPVRSAAQA